MVHMTPFHWLSVVRSFALCVTRYFFCPRGMALNDQEERERDDKDSGNVGLKGSRQLSKQQARIRL